MRLRIILLLGLAGSLAGAGCEFPFAGASGQKPKEPLPLAAPRQMLATALAKRAPMTSMKAGATMRIIDRKSDFGLGVNIDLLASVNPDRLRIHATKASMEAFDALVGKGRIAFYVPRKKTLYQGSVEDLAKAKIPFQPGDVLTNLLAPDRDLLGKEWIVKHEHMNFIEIGDAVVLAEAGPRPHWMVYLEPNTHLLLAVEELDDAGQVVFVKFYDRYRTVVPPTPPGTRNPPILWYPYRMKLEWPLDERSVEVSFKDIEPNATFPGNWSTLDLPEGVEVKPIEQAQVEGDKLDTMDGGALPDAGSAEDAAPRSQPGDTFHGVAR